MTDWTRSPGPTSSRGMTTPFEILFSVTLYRDGLIRINGRAEKTNAIIYALRAVATSIENGHTVLTENDDLPFGWDPDEELTSLTMDEEEHLAEVVELRPQPDHFPCPNCGNVWWETVIVLDREGHLAARTLRGRCIECREETDLPG